MSKTTILISIFSFLILTFFIYSFFSKKAPIVVPDFAGASIVAFGDSLIAGNGASKDNDLVSLLSQSLHEPIINLGVPGDTSALGLARIDTVLAQKPKLVFVLFGGNDFLKKVPIDTTFQNLEQIILQLQNANATVVLLGIQGGVLNDPFEKRFKQLAKKYNVVYVPNVLKNIIGHKNLMSDSIHPNDQGYKLMAEKILKVVNEELVI